jgi:hypothetical protein
MDEADDAVGRVAIFSIEPAIELDPPPPPAGRGSGSALPTRWIGAVADAPLGAAVVAACLVLLLVLGLSLTH